MSFEGFNDKDEPISDINMTPLIDVMLVLLVIFIITAPLLTHAIKLDLPKEQAKSLESEAKSVTISIDSKGQLFWNADKLQLEDLDKRFNAQVIEDKNISIQLRADNQTAYQWVAKVMAKAQHAGLNKIAFIVDDSQK
jgi:biopolymer transport protein ExbD